jgi:hypothetical protein
LELSGPLLSRSSRHAGFGAIFLRRKRDGFFVMLIPSHYGPSHSGNFVGERDSSDLGRPSRQQCRQPRPMLCAVVGIVDHGESSGGELATQIAIALLADTAELVLAALECCFGTVNER